MPLLDHFHPPVKDRYPWESFHAGWATRIADALNDSFPPEFVAVELARAGAAAEIDVATWEETPRRANGAAPGAATLATPLVWTPPAPWRTAPAIFPDAFEVQVFRTLGGYTLVGAIELISRGNKDRPEERRAFAAKCASYLHQGVSVIIIDIVTARRANLHNELIRLLDASTDMELPAETELYAVAYRPVLRDARPEIDLWTAAFRVGDALPVMPLRLTGDLFAPVDFESAYEEACRKRRLI